MGRFPRQSEVWDVELDPVRGREQAGTRPALVISKDGFNSSPSRLCVVAPITSTRRGFMAHVQIDPPEGGLTTPSSILCDQIRTVSLDRLRRPRGNVEATTLETVIRMLHRIVG